MRAWWYSINLFISFSISLAGSLCLRAENLQWYWAMRNTENWGRGELAETSPMLACFTELVVRSHPKLVHSHLKGRRRTCTGCFWGWGSFQLSFPCCTFHQTMTSSCPFTPVAGSSVEGTVPFTFLHQVFLVNARTFLTTQVRLDHDYCHKIIFSMGWIEL